MATLILQSAGAIVGGMIGGPVGAVLGQAAGAIAGNIVDRSLLGSIGAKDIHGPRLSRMPAGAASEGTAIARVFGRVRIGGTLIWMTRFEEMVTVARAGRSGGKGSRPTATSYTYYANFAAGLCEGPIAAVRRIWADGKELDQTEFTIRVHRGDEAQAPDPLIVAKEGAANAPAYRGLAYVVFERFPLEEFGNRIPVLSFEVVRPVGGLAEKVTAVCVIPGSSEYGYSPRLELQLLQPGVTRSENRHQLVRDSDWNASMDMLQALCPNLKSVALVVTWFGDDLRAGACTVHPRVEIASKITSGAPWSVAGLNRLSVPVVSQYQGAPAYGGTPSDDAVMAAIQDLRARGLDVVFYPFVMMDVPHGNALPDPWTGAVGQPPYPWRGRITCHPAPGLPASPDASAAAGQQVDHFFGSHTPGPGEFSFRRFILHYANLCQLAGGVDAFLVGTEMAALTRVRSAPGVYPAASHLATLAGDVRQILGPSTAISYAADWTEYGAHVLDDGDEVRFPLDVVWSRPEVDFVGVDAYWPLSDWRDGADHLDAAETESIYDANYLRARVAAGEDYDWYYPDAAARVAQNRVAITDGAYGKPWIHRRKDLVGWWSNLHFERVGGQELPTPTGWVPESKPFWLTEVGCPAVDKGANAPNVFPDEKSSENRLPHFSRGHRDDLIQARAVTAMIGRFDPQHPDFADADNPVSSVYGGRMVAADRTHVWAWDARPFPAFPALGSVWADAPAWSAGHWINGRLEAVTLDALLGALVGQVPDMEHYGARMQVDAIVDGYMIDRPMSPRSAIEPLSVFYGFDAVVSGGAIAFIDRRYGRPARFVVDSDLVAVDDKAPIERVRAQESELSRLASITVYDGDGDFRPLTVQSRRVEGHAQRETHLDAPVVCSLAEARRRANIFLQDMWVGRETVRFAAPPSRLALETGDHVEVIEEGVTRRYRVTQIQDSMARLVHARAIEPSVFDHRLEPQESAPSTPPAVFGPPLALTIDLAIANGDPPGLQYLAVFADPWPGAMAIWRKSGEESFEPYGAVSRSAMIGRTLAEFASGPVGRYDHRAELVIELDYGALASLDRSQALAGKPAVAVQGTDLAWEILAYANAELIGERRYRLTRLVRGLGGAEHLAARTLAPGSTVVVLDEAVVRLTTDTADINAPHVYRVGPARRDHADPACVQFETAATTLALRPYAPVRPRAVRDAHGVTITFTRRSRVGADAWEQVEVPLGEGAEAYQAEILHNGAVKRLLHAAEPQFVYAASSELSDFGAEQTDLELRIYQLSALAGRGFPFEGILPVQ